MTDRRYAPSEYHLDLLARTPREHAWRGQEFGPWQDALRARLLDLLGGMPEREPSLDVEEIEREETDQFVRTRIVFRSEPAADVPAHLLVPKGRGGPLPAVVCIQGHNPGMHLSLGDARDAEGKPYPLDDRDFALQAVRHGFVALAMEQRCFGERAETRQAVRDTCTAAALHSLLLGRTLAGERVWDVTRAIDLLRSQPEVDAERIACMGNSGGGTVTFYAACLDPRIKLAVASCCFGTFADVLMRIRHCADNYVPGILRAAEMGELAGLIAPRRLLVVSGAKDEIFPLEGARAAFAQAQEVFTACGCADNVRMIVGPEGHRFYANLAWPVIAAMMQ